MYSQRAVHRTRRFRVAWRNLILPFLLTCLTGVAAVALAEARVEAPALVIRDARQQTDALRPKLERALDLTARGSLDAAEIEWRTIREAYPNHPAGYVLAIETLHWRKSVDFMSTEFDKDIRSLAERGIELADAWIKRSPKSAEPHFYRGHALVALMKLNGMLGNLYTAGTQGEAGRESLEEALRLDPKLIDAKLPLGTYYYYASIATRYVRWLTWLWFVPTGEHDTGMAYVAEAARDGDLLRFEAMTQLSRIYLYNEEMPEKAAPVVAELARLYPENSYVRFEVLELQMMLGDYESMIAAALPVEASETNQVGAAKRRRMARIWRARAQMLLGKPDEAAAILNSPLLALEDLRPYERRWVLVTQGNLQDLAGGRKQAVRSYTEVVELATRWGSHRSVDAAKAGLEEPFELSANKAALPAVGLSPEDAQ